MNQIRKSMNQIQASEELKKNTLQYLKGQQKRSNYFRKSQVRVAPYLILAALCSFVLLVGVRGYSIYNSPVSYISIDVNPSIELGINRFERVVSAVAYNKDGENVLQKLSLKNVSYIQAIDKILEEEKERKFLTENAQLFFTVISDESDAIIKQLEREEAFQIYGAMTYTSDKTCMQEAHQYEMSFGKYRACMELSQYDESITIEECHGMTIGEIQSRIEKCRQYGQKEEVESEEIESEEIESEDKYPSEYPKEHEQHHRNGH